MAESENVGTFGRYKEVAKEKMSPNMRAAYDFTMKLRGQVPGRIRSGCQILGCLRR